MFNSQCAILSRSECRIAVGKGIGGGVLLAALLAANPFACSRPAIRAGEVRGRGLLLALELKGAVSSQIVEAALRRGLLVNAPRPTAIRFMPALNVTREEIDQMIGILRETIRSVI